MAHLLSVNVGMPRDVEWRGRIVRTAIWKYPVQGRCRVTRLNVQGDAQADLLGHGGEQRAVFVYQLQAYHYWSERLGRHDLANGHFGENFTVDGLADDEVCIGDCYQIGTALFQVTQPRVTCYRVGIRLDDPRMPALLTSSAKPGFYFRVLREGEVGAGDEVTLVERGAQHMTVAQVNALLYSPHHPRDQLELGLRIAALSPGWRLSFEALLRAQDAGASGNAGLAPAAAAITAAPGFRRLRVERVAAESGDVLSLVLKTTDGSPLTTARPGQFVVLRMQAQAEGPPLLRSYSLSGPPSDVAYRISVKLEPGGAAGEFLSRHVRAGDTLEVSEPRGSFILREATEPVVLLSAGIGATPVLAMLHALATAGTARQVWWLHSARNAHTRVFSREVNGLLARLENARGYVWHTQPGSQERESVHFDFQGRLSVEALDALGVPRSAEFYLCGPAAFLQDVGAMLVAWGVRSDRIHSEIFSGGPSMAVRAPHQPDGAAGTGPLVSFVRSGIAIRWRASESNFLELAEACDVPVRWSCRTGVCHNCESGLVSGRVSYDPAPLDAPASGNVLICCARPEGDVVIDL